MSDTFFPEIDINTAVSSLQQISRDHHESMKYLGYQLNNCQFCLISEDCDWSMRKVRLQSGTCHYIVSN